MTRTWTPAESGGAKSNDGLRLVLFSPGAWRALNEQGSVLELEPGMDLEDATEVVDLLWPPKPHRFPPGATLALDRVLVDRVPCLDCGRVVDLASEDVPACRDEHAA